MAKLVKIIDALSVNPELVTSVRETSRGSIYIELSTGTRHELVKTTVAAITDLLNGEAHESSD